eukprot:TRINITY_DN1569_c0_g1_i1.p1 TRINITY_DN1569_c0_g1~~TRINITY_DN1569_c0_g1_i1.p1  ORF type:complete len:198 (+),score=67.56 TRINITY_DN1569_c0_g1_i1:100-693(+)
MGSKNSTLWKDVYTNTQKQTEKVTKAFVAMSPKEGQVSKDDQKKVEEAIQSEWKKFETQNKEMLKKIFSAYDADKSGTLDKNEIKTLVKESLIAQKQMLPKLTDGMIELTAQLSLARLKTEEEKKAAKKQIQELKTQILSTSTGVLNDLITKYEAVAEELFTKIDTNGDGKLQLEEFLIGYMAASGEIVKTFMPQLG